MGCSNSKESGTVTANRRNPPAGYSVGGGMGRQGPPPHGPPPHGHGHAYGHGPHSPHGAHGPHGPHGHW